MAQRGPSVSWMQRYVAETLLRTILLPLCRVIWKVRLHPNSKRLPTDEACFVYGPHSHNFDPFFLNMYTPWYQGTRGVMTREYLRQGISSWIMHGIGLLPTAKRIPEPHVIRGVLGMLRDKKQVVIYPEGGRRWDGRAAPWIESTAKLFHRAGVPVYPVVVHGGYLGWPRWATFPRPSRLEVEILEPIHLSKDMSYEEVLARLNEVMKGDEADAPTHLRPKWAYKPAAGVERIIYRDPDSGRFNGVSSPDGTTVCVGDVPRWKMHPDSSLEDLSTGDRTTVSYWYEQVRNMALPADGSMLAENVVEISRETAFPAIDRLGEGSAKLFVDRIELSGCLERTIMRSEILYTGIERNRKLQVFLDGEMIELHFVHDGSALGWEHVLGAGT